MAEQPQKHWRLPGMSHANGILILSVITKTNQSSIGRFYPSLKLGLGRDL
jgi:hypothetical protein